MKISITSEDVIDGQITVIEDREPSDGKNETSMTLASSLADAMFEGMDQLGEITA